MGEEILAPTVKVNNVSVQFKTGDFKAIGIKEYVIRRLHRNYHVKEFWADKDITFSLEKGDMLGIIGSNGAGKSTLLKVISGVLTPTSGSAETEGSIAALLELTAGFDPSLTVRDNTFLRGAIMGYSKKFMQEQYEEIIRFAELEDFQDTPFRQLSSGMKSRLAFSIGCLVNPDILILDEVLSVGDTAFRKKSGEKMMEVLQGGVTGLLVSHSISQLKEICNKILWLDHGRQIVFSNDVGLCCDAYSEFQETKQLPESMADIEALAAACRARRAEERKKKMEKEAIRLQKEIERCDSEAAVNAALNILRKSRPELLNGKMDE